MKSTIQQAENNERNLSITLTGYGHYKIECNHRGKRISTITTKVYYVDDFKAEWGEKDYRGANRRKKGYEGLVNEIINSNKK